MTKESPRHNDDFLVQHLVDPADWVADHERALCSVCTRQFSTFRRKHHCRMCGEIVCSNCTLLKNAFLATIGYTRVRVCITCVFNHAHIQKVRPHSPPSNQNTATVASTVTSSLTTTCSEESREWTSSHLHSPLSSSGQAEYDTEGYGSGDSYEDAASNDNNYSYNNNAKFRAQYRSPTILTSSSSSSNNSNNQIDNDWTPTHLISRGNPQDEDAGVPKSQWPHPWPKPPVAADEESRLHALHALDVLDSPPEKPYDMICDLAKARLSCPMAAVSFMGEQKQWFKASVGLAHKSIPRKISFCAYTVFTKEPVVVLDMLKDKRFESNPLVSGAAAVRFYAAAPILDPSSGHAVGSVFVLDKRPRESCDVAILERLARAAAENLPRVAKETPEQDDLLAKVSPISIAKPSKQFDDCYSSTEVSPPSPANRVVNAGKQAPPSPVNNNSFSDALVMGTASPGGEPMEALLIRLLTQNTETQHQLATQQMSISHTLGYHSTQISKLMTNFARMEAKIEAQIK
uniref:FYVE-type domain-containing protein n=1 Tax=Globisporangium ultimum (strain ATCC 200006 / CBS 805.95 / DAOM BR144) TaxID=431595 RepID=K3WGS2_GLOUD